jgi:hypothetical protein
VQVLTRVSTLPKEPQTVELHLSVVLGGLRA